MIELFRRFWPDIGPIFGQPEKREQVAALCYIETSGGKKVLLVTSRCSVRWIVPKVCPITGKNGADSALQEAWEEAGVSEADVISEPLGQFGYDKGMPDGTSVPIETTVYLAHVQNLKKSYPEVDQRERAWFSPAEAANLVEAPELKALLREIS